MLVLFAVSAALSVGLLVFLVLSLVPRRSRVVTSRMAEMGLEGLFSADASAKRLRERSRLRDLLRYFGEMIESRGNDWVSTRKRLIRAGHRDAGALALFLGIRCGGCVILGFYGLSFAAAVDQPPSLGLVYAMLGAGAGWFVPGFLLSARISRRQKEIQQALPDALDLLVICVEAGLGLNQALLRVGEEMRHSSRPLTEELALTNAEIRAGAPRDQALLRLHERTGVPDVRSLATMLIQTERFGTSIGHSLRIHAESMRTKRRQRAEEAAAKTTIKMIFPLALCILPALFVVVLGPAIISIIQTLSQLG